MENQNLNLYYIFYVTAGCGNISSAAKELYISQPAISKAISKLENNLGCILFTRNSRGVKLTSEGQLLYKQLETAFHAISAGEETLKRNGELGVGELSIGVSSTLCKYVLLPYLKTFVRENPYVKISISCQSTNETIAALENGSLDIGLIGETDRLDNLTFAPLSEIQDTFVTTKEYMDFLCKKCDISGPIKNKDAGKLLSNATLLLLDQNNITRQYIDKYMILQDISAEQQIEVTSMELLIEFAKIGLGVACVIDGFVKEDLADGSLVHFPLKAPIPKRKIGIAMKNKVNPTVSMNKFMEVVTREK
ncbi:MAG: LysR family transcriptional regulator [Lachnospiraceae bacterium]|nr:LysR family transcriptional regulator [Lachnospiraceae bacterium]